MRNVLVAAAIFIAASVNAHAAEILSASAKASGTGYATISVKYRFDKNNRADTIFGFYVDTPIGGGCIRLISDYYNKPSTNEFTFRCNVPPGAKGVFITAATVSKKLVPIKAKIEK